MRNGFSSLRSDDKPSHSMSRAERAVGVIFMMSFVTFVVWMSMETDKALGEKIDQLVRNHENHKLYVEQQLAEVAARDPEDNEQQPKILTGASPIGQSAAGGVANQAH